MKTRDLTVSDAPALFGCTPLFDACFDAPIMSLSFEGTAPFLDWIGWERTSICTIKKAFLNFARAESLNGSASPGWLANPCNDANSFETDYCDFTLTDFARLRRDTPSRDITKSGVLACEASPRHRLDGTPITDQLEYDFRLAMEVLLQDLKVMVVNGNQDTAGQFDGLESLVKTGYANANGSLCPAMDSIVIDWNNNDMDGGSGITWNGAAVGTTYNYIDVLMAIVRRIRHRIRMAPALAAQAMNVGDMILLIPSEFAACVLDSYTCWSVCGNDVTLMLNQEARTFRQTLSGGLYGAGRIYVDGFEIPIMPYDWGLISSGQTFDSYILTGAVGNVKLIQGQYNDLEIAALKRPVLYDSTDNGRFLTWLSTDNTCEKQNAEMQPRLLAWAPWAQARIMDVVCGLPGGVLSADPWSSYFPY